MLRHALGRSSSALFDAGAGCRAVAPAWHLVRPVVCIGERALNASAAGLQAFSERMHTTARSFADDSNRAEESAGDSTQQASSQEHQQPQHEDAGSRPEESASEQPPPTIESLQAIIEEHRATAQQHAASSAEMKDQVLRTLADMENLRERSARQIESNKQFAVQGFAKSLLDVADNLERAAGAVPAEAVAQDTQLSVHEVVKHLRTLLEGVQLTDKQLKAALKSNGVSKYDALGEKFDPNLHSALFEIPDTTKPPGTIGVVTKNGYKLNDRVLRAAEVGVIRGPAE
mmetsp:Transcript_8481/g.25465  ORF Transcript_8481/g.25465 Transcript_8481/m.25465 type:complete len:287 (+) Transcript_8481:132-992(+)